MLKTVLLFLVAVGMTLMLSGCGHWGCWGGHKHGSTHNNHSHSHHRGCGHTGY